MKTTTKILSIFFAASVLISCNKNQSAIKKLDGTWIMVKVEVTENGETQDLISIGGQGTMTFSKCELKENEYCDMTETFTYPDGDSYTENKEFRVTNDGENLEFYNASNSVEPTITFSIEKLTRKELVIFYQGANNAVRTELEKNN